MAESKTQRTPEEVRAIRMANLKQNKPKDIENKIPEELNGVIFTYVKNLLSNAEFFLYVDELKMWVKDHPDWNLKEDIDDLNGIAMEKVIQFRLLSDKKSKKSVDIDKEYNSSKNREMVHRNNLGARRATRVTEITKNTTINNVVNIAGAIDDGKLKKLVAINQKEEEEDEKLFPVIDVEEIHSKEE